MIDSALVIASNLPKEKVGYIFQKVSNYILNGEIEQIYFNHYIEALSNWDMDKLVSIIYEGKNFFMYCLKNENIILLKI